MIHNKVVWYILHSFICLFEQNKFFFGKYIEINNDT